MPNLNTLDLNLIRIFDAVMRERSVVRAANSLGLTASAVSHGLGRLRQQLHDELFVRTRDGMVPTTKAIEIDLPLRVALQEIGTAFGTSVFDPATTRRRFVLAANDALTAIVGPRLVALFARRAPGADLVIRAATRHDLAEQIDTGHIDVALGVFSDIPPRFQARQALAHRDIAVVRSSHPLARHDLRVDDLTRFPLAVASFGEAEAGAVGGFILERGLARQSDLFDRPALDAALAVHGMRPRFGLVVPHFLALPMLLRQSDAIAIMSRILAVAIAGQPDLTIKPLPYTTTPAAVRAIWHERTAHLADHAWFRDLVLEAALECQNNETV